MPKVSQKPGNFLWVGNTPSLDFVNTELVQNGGVVDLLTAPEDLAAWLRYAGFRLQAGSRGARALVGGLGLAKEYRATLRSGVTQLTRTGSLPREVVAATNLYIARSGERRSLVKKASGWELLRHWHIESAADYVAPIATSFAKFIARADLTRVRKCRNPACILFFYDTSKSGTRSWCSLDICGNRMRVAAFRERRATKEGRG